MRNRSQVLATLNFNQVLYPRPISDDGLCLKENIVTPVDIFT